MAWKQPWPERGSLEASWQINAIREGALFPYCKNEKLYRCPNGLRGEMLTYAIVDGMNGYTQGRGEAQIKKPGIWIKKRTEIHNPPPAYRIVFIDEGWASPDSYAVHFLREMWWDDLPSRHGDGTNLAFADGHSEYYKWKGLWTIQFARATEYRHPRSDVPPGATIILPGGEQKNVKADTDDFEDLYFIQKGCWGGLGYTPTH
jgi:prepilin-type processing-associated H-X9-DG protein